MFWTFFERTKPQATNARRVAALTYSNRSYSGYTPLQTNYPSPTIYYDQDRLQFLQTAFSLLWTRNQQEALYKKLQAELDAASDQDRIYPSLALSYCYWWAGQREEAQRVLAILQKEFPEDLTLKLNTIFASIQAGQHAAAFKLITGLAEADPRNRKQYYELTLQLAAQTGDTVAVRELVTKVLNSPSGARELYQFSRALQQKGLTQHATAIAKKAMTLAMGERDPNFLVDLSQHLEELGRGQEAARIAARAMRDLPTSATATDRHCTGGICSAPYRPLAGQRDYGNANRSWLQLPRKIRIHFRHKSGWQRSMNRRIRSKKHPKRMKRRSPCVRRTA